MLNPPPAASSGDHNPLPAIEDHSKLTALIETSRLLSSIVSLDDLLQLVMQETTRVLDAERSSLFLLDAERGELWSKIAQGIDDVELRFPVSRGIAGHVARTGEVANLVDAYDDPRFNKEIDRGTGFRTRSMLVVPLKNRQGDVLGVVQALNKRSGEPFDGGDVEMLGALAVQAAISIENARLYERIEGLFEAFVGTIVAAIDARDPITSGHSHRVADYAINLARSLHHSSRGDVTEITFTRAGLRALRYAALLHDVGKIGVREAVLCKRYTLLVPEHALVEERIRRAIVETELETLRAGKLPDPAALGELERLLELVDRRRTPGPIADDDADVLRAAHERGLLTERQFRCLSLDGGNLIDVEWRDMASHVSKSYELLTQIPWTEPLRRVPEIAWSHHEKVDGSGYPRGVKAAEYPFEGQLLAVADIYDALTASDRPYKRSYTRSEAHSILDQEVERGRLDGRLVDVFFEDGCFELPPDTPRPAAEPPPDLPL